MEAHDHDKAHGLLARWSVTVHRHRIGESLQLEPVFRLACDQFLAVKHQPLMALRYARRPRPWELLGHPWEQARELLELLHTRRDTPSGLVRTRVLGQQRLVTSQLDPSIQARRQCRLAAQ